MKEFIKTVMEKEKEHVVFLRRELHKRAELSNEEYKTAEFIESYLKNIGYTPKRVTKTGVVAFLDCGFSETVLLRADMDALPVTELHDTEYKSQTEGVMHACGHDAHMAMVLCTAKVLKVHQDKLNKNVLFVFQPKEETDGGAQYMIAEGILEEYKVSMALGFHVSNDVPAGSVMIKSGALMASPDDFEIKISGCGGHGALPEKCVDPLSVSANIIPKLNNITNMVIKEGERQVVQVCQLNSGTSSNVIPDESVMFGTARSFDNDVRVKIPEIMKKIIDEEAESVGATAHFKFNYRYPPLVNDKTVAKKVKELIIKNIGDIVLTWENGQMTGEDFSYFAEAIPSLFIFLGTGNEKKGITMPLHSENFEIDEEGLIVGVGIYTAFLMD